MCGDGIKPPYAIHEVKKRRAQLTLLTLLHPGSRNRLQAAGARPEPIPQEWTAIRGIT